MKKPKYYTVGTIQKSNKKKQKYYTAGTIQKSNRKTKNTTLSEQLKNLIEKPKILHCRNNSKI